MTKDSFDTTIRFLTTAEIASWLISEDWLARLEIGSLSLLEHLTNDLERPDDPPFEISPQQAADFLSRLDSALQQPNDQIRQRLAPIFGVLMSYLAEAGPTRFESKRSATNPPIVQLLDQFQALRLQVAAVLRKLFACTIFDPLREAIEREIVPMIASASEAFDGSDERYLPFRVIIAGAIAEQLRFLRLRVEAQRYPDLDHLLGAMYDLKYIRFGTSGYRGVWQRDFTEDKVKVVTQAICDFLKLNNLPKYASSIGADLSGRVIVIGCDGRRTSTHIAGFVAEICLANGFIVYFASRPTPTPALNFFATQFIGRGKIAGLINCTASHNPPEWQGIKFNPAEGYPAPTTLTDVIASRATTRQLLRLPIPATNIDSAETVGTFHYFDPKNIYLDWLRQSGHGNHRISVDLAAIKRYFADKLITLDPMYGAGREYLTTILGELGIPYVSIHDERDEDLGKQVEQLGGVRHLEYANPEPPFIQPLIDKVIATKAAIGLGTDTDADRFGVVDRGGIYIRPNQILAMLTRYLGIERGQTGRVIITQTGLPMIDAIAGQIPDNEAYRPPTGTIPAYISSVFYHRQVGESESIAFPNTYVVPVGIKYIVDVARVADGVTNPANAYKAQPDADMPDTWMERMLIGGEESSGLTTRGHVPDKDGIWANLLILDMLAYYGLRSPKGETSLSEIWEQTTELAVTWKIYGDRIDVDATTEAKEALLNYFLDVYKDWKHSDLLPQLAGLDIYYLGGTRYDFVEIFLQDAQQRKRYFLRVRASGTEPITRIYVESAERSAVDRLLNVVLERLDAINVEVIAQAYSIERLADLLSNTRFAEPTLAAVDQVIRQHGWYRTQLLGLLDQRRPHVESRNAKLIEQWKATL